MSMSGSHLAGILLISTTKEGTSLVFHYPPENFNSPGPQGTEPVVIETNDEGEPQIEDKDNSNNGQSQFTTNSKITAAKQSKFRSSYIMEYSDDEFDEIYNSEDDKSSVTSSDKVDGQTSGLFIAEEEGEEEIEEEDSEEEEIDDENVDGNLESQKDFVVETDYDSNNPLMSFEEFNNDYFIENILGNDYSLAKLKYKVSYDCTTKLSENNKPVKSTKTSHHRYQRPINEPKFKKSYPKLPLTPIKLTPNDPSSNNFGKNLLDKKELFKRKASLHSQIDDVFNLKSNYLCDMLTPNRLCNELLEIKIDNYCFLGLPTDNGKNGWSRFYPKEYQNFRKKFNKLRQKNQLKNLNIESTEISEKDYSSIGNNSDLEIDEDRDDKLQIFNLVFVINPPAGEYQGRKKELQENILSKITFILSREQGKNNYVGEEIKKIFEAKKEFFSKIYHDGKGVKLNNNNSKINQDDHEMNSTNSGSNTDDEDELYLNEEYLDNYFTIQNLYRLILSKSTLAKSLIDCYHNLHSSQIFKLNINKTNYSFNIPVKKNFSILPHSSVKLQHSDINSMLKTIPMVDEIFENDYEISSNFKQNTMFIGTLLDDSFHKEKLFPSVSNLSNLSDYFYLDSFQNEFLVQEPNYNNLKIIEIFKDCSYDLFSLLILDDLNDILKEVNHAVAKDIKCFIKKIDATIPLKKIIKKVYEERKIKLEKYKTLMDKKKNSKNDIKLIKNKMSLLNKFENDDEKESLMINIIYHLIYWEKVKFILPITKRTKFVVSPLANLGTDLNDLRINNNNNKNFSQIRKFDSKKFNQLDSKSFEIWLNGFNKRLHSEFRLEFPSLPPLSEFLANFNLPKTYQSFSDNEIRSLTYLDACCWLLKNGLIVQFYTFGWIKITSKIKMRVQEDHDYLANKKFLSNSKNSNSSESSFKRESFNEENSSHFSNNNLIISNNNFNENEDTVILNPNKPNFLEKKCINKMLDDKSMEIKFFFYKMMKYLNGKIPLELMLLKENIKRSDYKKVLEELKDYIIIDTHW